MLIIEKLIKDHYQYNLSQISQTRLKSKMLKKSTYSFPMFEKAQNTNPKTQPPLNNFHRTTSSTNFDKTWFPHKLIKEIIPDTTFISH